MIKCVYFTHHDWSSENGAARTSVQSSASSLSGGPTGKRHPAYTFL